METTQEIDMMTKDVAVQDVRPPEMMKLTAAEIRADVNLIQTVLKAVMIKDVHYGIIPGTPKPTLYKPGAEKILSTFRLNAEPLIEDLSGPDEIRYRLRIRVTHQVTKLEIGWGVGECPSNETKYKWIAPVCNEEWDETPEDRRREKWKKGKNGDKVFKKKEIRANLSDVANTVLKMAKKRGLVDATLTCTGASDVFDQDIEDMPEGIRQNVVDATRAPMPQRADEKVAYTPPAAAPANVNKKTGEITDDPNDSVEDPPTKPAQRRIIDLTGARNMVAKYEKPCKLCGKKFTIGQQIVWLPEGPDKGDYHIACVNG